MNVGLVFATNGTLAAYNALRLPVLIQGEAPVDSTHIAMGRSPKRLVAHPYYVVTDWEELLF